MIMVVTAVESARGVNDFDDDDDDDDDNDDDVDI